MGTLLGAQTYQMVSVQGYLPSGHGCHSSVASRNHTIFSRKDGVVSTVVRLLDICSSLDRAMVILRLQASH